MRRPLSSFLHRTERLYRIGRPNCVRYLATTEATTEKSFINFQRGVDDDVLESLGVYPGFLTEAEGDALVNDIDVLMKRRRYENGHWDAVITKYKEIELADNGALSDLSRSVLEKTRNFLFERHFASHGSVPWLPCHAIDLKQDGELKAHVDSIRFSGRMVAGLSLVSSCIMRLRKSPGVADVGEVNEKEIDLLLSPLSLYVLTDASRYDYSHELLPCGSIFEARDGTKTTVNRDRRLSIIFRDALKE